MRPLMPPAGGDIGAFDVEPTVEISAVEPPLQHTRSVTPCCRGSTALQRSTALYILQLYTHYILQRSTSSLSLFVFFTCRVTGSRLAEKQALYAKRYHGVKSLNSTVPAAQ